ncbi:putative MFS multidrug transporter [Hyaloscypha variabilis]
MASDNNDQPVTGDLEKAPATVKDGAQDEDEYPPFAKVVIIMTALYLAMFLVALDRTILGTAIPMITDDFHSINDVGWYASSYLLTLCAFQLIYGRLYTFYTGKWLLLGTILLFEIGSAVCGSAPNSIAFIMGRAISGLGAAGIFSGCINIMVITVPLHKRPMYQGIFGSVFGLASICGPLLGGVFTTKVSWRWCFYINLPIGAVVLAIISTILKTPPKKNELTLREQFIKLDPIGTIFFLPGIICLLLALQWGGTTYAWSNWRIPFLFVIAAVLLGIFIFVQFKMGDNATVPIRIIKQRSIASGVYFSALVAGTMMVVLYFIPQWFQAVKGVSAIHSGISTLPIVMALVVASFMAGFITLKTGYYVSQLIICSVIMSIGAGLLTTLKVDTNHSLWITYEFLYGLGLGFGMQQAGMAAQACLPKQDVMTGVALMFFMQGLGGAAFVSVGQVIFTNSLVKKLDSVASISPNIIVHTGATEIRNIVPPQYLEKVLVAYNGALSDTLKLSLACAAATIVAGLTMEWKSVKGLKKGGPPAKAEEKAEDLQTDTATSAPRTPEPLVAEEEKEGVRSTAEESSKAQQ